MFIFFAILCVFLMTEGTPGCRKTAARQAMCSNGWHKSLAPTYLSYECCKTITRSQCNDLVLYCKAAARMLRNIHLPLKIAQLSHGCTTGTVRCLSLSCGSLANLHNHLAADLHLNLKYSYERRTATLVTFCVESSVMTPFRRCDLYFY